MLHKLNVADVESAKSAFLNNLVDEVKVAENSSVKQFIISSEHCMGRLYDLEEVERLFKLISPLFDEVEVVSVLRPQAEAIVSMASTTIQSGRPILRSNLHERLGYWNAKHNYYEVLEKWRSAFGGGSMICLPYKRIDPLKYFETRILGLAPGTLEVVPRRNTSLSVRALNLANLIIRPEDPAPLRERLLRQIAAAAPGESLRLPRSDIEKIQKTYRPSNEKLIDRWTHLSMSDVEVDPQAWDIDGNVAILAEGESLAPSMRNLALSMLQDLDNCRNSKRQRNAGRQAAAE